MAELALSKDTIIRLLERRGLVVVAFFYEPMNDNAKVRVFKDGPRRDFPLPRNFHRMTVAEFDDQVVDQIAKEMAA